MRGGAGTGRVGPCAAYLLVLVTAIAGMNVLKVLLLGIAASGAIGLATGSFDLLAWCGGMGQGITGMGELIIVTMMAGDCSN